MYQGKFNSKPVRRRRNGKKSLALVVSLALLMCLVVGGTAAFLTTQSDSVTNTFVPGQVTTYVNEEFKDNAKEKVTVTNTGNTDAWIRVAVVVNWKNEDGQVYGLSPVAGTDYVFAYNNSDWIKGSDGFYYYKSSVASMNETGNLLKEKLTVVANSDNNVKANAAGYYLNVEILGSGIQSKPASTFNTVWASSGLTASGDSLS